MRLWPSESTRSVLTRGLIVAALFAVAGSASCPPWTYSFSAQGMRAVYRPAPRAPIFAPPEPERLSIYHGVQIDAQRLGLEILALIALSGAIVVLLSVPSKLVAARGPSRQVGAVDTKLTTSGGFPGGRRECSLGGRRYWLQRIYIEYSYRGVLAGDPKVVSKRKLQQVEDLAARALGSDIPYVTVSLGHSVGQILPAFTVVSEFTSPEPVAKAGCYSVLGIVWWLDDLNEPIAEHIPRILGKIDWNQHAVDFDWAEV